jgi:hypothetical protein
MHQIGGESVQFIASVRSASRVSGSGPAMSETVKHSPAGSSMSNGVQQIMFQDMWGWQKVSFHSPGELDAGWTARAELH